MNNAPAFQHYAGDFLSHPVVGLMTAQEIGAYWLLINYCWKLGELPDDLEELAIYARVPFEEFQNMFHKRIQRCFLLSERSTWIHPHLEAERVKHENIREVRQKASETRWNKQKPTKPDANAMQMQSLSSSTSSSTSFSEQDSANGSHLQAKTAAKDSPLVAVSKESTPAVRRIWKDGVDLLTQSGVAEKSARSLLGKLAKEYTNERLAEAIAVTQAKNPVNAQEFLIATLKERKNGFNQNNHKRTYETDTERRGREARERMEFNEQAKQYLEQFRDIPIGGTSIN